MQNAPLAMVKSENCHLLKRPTHPFILVLNYGENLFSQLVACAEKMELKAASLSGLGALDEVTIAYYDLPTKQYQTKLFADMYELISLNGNITTVDNKPSVHIHAALGTREHNVIGGHIMDATVGPTAEITIIPFASEIHRQHNDKIGLKLMCNINS